MPKPYFPSISLVLAQARRLKDPQQSYCRKPQAFLPPVQDNLMQSEDERDHISLTGLDMSTPYISEHDDRLISLHKALDTDEVDDPTVRVRRFSVSSLVIDLSWAAKRKYQRLRVKNCITNADSIALA